MANTSNWDNIHGNFGASTAGLAQASRTLKERISTLENLTDRISTYGKEMEAKAIAEKENILAQQGKAISNQALLDAVDENGTFHQDRYAASITNSMQQSGIQNYRPEDLVKLQANIDTNTADQLKINIDQNRNALLGRQLKNQEEKTKATEIKNLLGTYIQQYSTDATNLNNPDLSDEDRIALKQRAMDYKLKIKDLAANPIVQKYPSLQEEQNRIYNSIINFEENNSNALPYAYYANNANIPTIEVQKYAEDNEALLQSNKFVKSIGSSSFNDQIKAAIEKKAGELDYDVDNLFLKIEKSLQDTHMQNFLKFVAKSKRFTSAEQLLSYIAPIESDSFLGIDNSIGTRDITTREVQEAIDSILDRNLEKFNGNFSRAEKRLLQSAGLEANMEGLAAMRKILKEGRI